MNPIPHSYPFDPTYGYSLDELLRILPRGREPQGFVDFWQSLRGRSDRVAMNPVIESLPSPDPAFRLLLAAYTVHPGYRVRAWVILPAARSPVRYGVVWGHGYGGREGPDWDKAGPDRAVIFPVAPGFHISADPRLPLNDSRSHVVFGIEDPETYVLGPCACALWRAVDMLEMAAGQGFGHIHYAGWSFGGGMGTLMLPWEPRIHSAELGQPTFGNHPLRLKAECTGSGEAVRRLHSSLPSIEKTLAFFDAGFAARRLRIPVVFACSVFDPAVPPQGQFSVANSHPGPKRISVFAVGHYDHVHPDSSAEDARHRANLLDLIGPAAVAG